MKEYRIETIKVKDNNVLMDAWLFENKKLIKLVENVKYKAEEFGKQLDINWICPQWVYNEVEFLNECK